jgi:hypothetical protein
VSALESYQRYGLQFHYIDACRVIPGGAGIRQCRPNEYFGEGHFNASARTLTFEKGADMKKRSEGLYDDRFYVHFPCKFFMENYTEVFYMIYKRDVPPFICKMSLDWSTAIGETDGMSLTFTDFYVPLLTTRLHCSETALQLSDNINSLRSVAYRHVSAKQARWTPGVSWRSFIHKL